MTDRKQQPSRRPLGRNAEGALLRVALLVGAAIVVPAQLGAQTISQVTPNPIPTPVGTAPVTLQITGTGLTSTGLYSPPYCTQAIGSATAPAVTVNQTAATVLAGFTPTLLNVSVPATAIKPPSVSIQVTVTIYNGIYSCPSGSASTTVPVAQQVTTTIILTVSPYPTTCGTATLTATVYTSGTSQLPLTGQVSLLDNNGTSNLGIFGLTGGSNSISTNYGLSVGTHYLSAWYQGDANYAQSTSPVVTETVMLPPSLSLTVSPGAAAVGQPVTLTATVTPNPGAGFAVSFQDGGTGLGTALTGANGVAVFTTSSLAQGNHSLLASYSSPCGIAQSNAVSETVGPAVTATTLTVSPAQTSVCQQVILTATVNQPAAGSVTFLDVTKGKPGSVLASSVPVTVGSATAVAAIQVQLPAGSIALEADFTPTSAASYNPSSGTANQTVLQAPSTTQLTALPVSSTPGQSVALTATVAACTGFKPTGTVMFSDGQTTLATAPLGSNATAAFATSSLTVGNHVLTAAYSGDSNFTKSSGTANETVGLGNTTTTLNASPNPAAYGQTVTLTAAVTPSAATGTVKFLDGTLQLGQAAVTGGTATLTVSSLAVGTHALTATYSGDVTYSASSGTANETVALAGTTTTLNASPSPAAYGQTVTLTATVTPSAATGTVKFLDGTAQLGQAAVTAGKATLTLSSLTVGSHSLSATYSGDTSYSTSSSSPPVSETVNKAATSTGIQASSLSLTQGQTVTLTATVTPAAVTGTVKFMDGTVQLSQTAVTGGTATLTLSSLAPGSHSLTASYGGDANYLASTSGTLSVSVSSTLQISSPALGSTPPTKLPPGTLNSPYTQTFTASGGSPPYRWSLPQSDTGDLQIGAASGVLSGTPTSTGTFNLTVQVQDSASPPATVQGAYQVTVNYPALPTVSLAVDNPQPPTPLIQPAPTLTLGQGYGLALSGTVTLSFQPAASVAGLPAGYVNKDLAFASGGISTAVSIPANSTSVPLPKIQVGTVAGTITATLGALTPAGSSQPLPFAGAAPSVAITLGAMKPLILSVKIANITASGFQVVLNADSTTRDLSLAELVFTSASGTVLSGTTSFTGSSGIPLNTAGPAWFSSTAGVDNGGGFTLTIPFGYSGDTSALSTVLVTLSNSQGKSDPLSGGR